MTLVPRSMDLEEVTRRLRSCRVTAILGPRQSGKTTLAHQVKSDAYFDLENPRDLARLAQSQLTLEPLSGLIVIDEIQRKPELFPLLRYLILGSASPDLLRDVPSLGVRIPSATLRRFWQMAGFYHGGMVNYSEIGRSFGAADVTVRNYLELLVGTFMVRLLPPWYANIGKRLVKRPKLYIRDSGIYHALLTVDDEDALLANPKLGASWEGFALECVWRSIGKSDEHAYFWATHGGAEVDLFWRHKGKNWACEFRYADASRMTRSMHTALVDLELERLWVVCPGGSRYPLHERVEVVPLSEVPPRWEYSVIG